MAKLLMAGLAGLVLGIICSRYILVGSALSLIPWALVGVALGAWADSFLRGATMGAMYGFWLTFSFMAAGYTGLDSVLTKIIPFAILGLFGAICGCVLGIAGFGGKYALLRRQSFVEIKKHSS